MRFHVLTLFPEMIEQGFHTSITGRAMEKGLLSLNAVNIRDFAGNKHMKVDDYPYGGGAGMVMQAEPVYAAHQSLEEQAGRKLRTIYLTPQGRTFNQKMAEEFAQEEELVFLCGHYEGIDERVLEEVVTDYVSIGDYVLTGGELPALVMMDTISRLVPGVLNNDVSAETESFQDSLLEYPQYSRPEEWRGKKVPPILLSGHHANVEKWRMVKKTGEVAEIASLKTKTLAKKKKIQDELLALGKAYYEEHKDEITEYEDKITAINTMYTELECLEEEMKALKEKLPEDTIFEDEDIPESAFEEESASEEKKEEDAVEENETAEDVVTEDVPEESTETENAEETIATAEGSEAVDAVEEESEDKAE